MMNIASLFTWTSLSHNTHTKLPELFSELKSSNCFFRLTKNWAFIGHLFAFQKTKQKSTPNCRSVCFRRITYLWPWPSNPWPWRPNEFVAPL